MPRTPSGKTDRRALARLEAAQVPPAAGGPPRSPVEEILSGIWQEVLGIERAGLHDSFFDLGGHSLSATRLMARVRAVFGVDLPLRAVFESPSLAALARRIEEARGAGLSPGPAILAKPRGGPLPLSFAQERLWFLDQLEPGTATYNIPLALDLEGPLAVPALAASLEEVVRRHESLRTTFPAADGRPVQAVALAPSLVLPVVDLTGLSGAGREGEARRLSAEAARRPFALAQGPLLRAVVLRLGAVEHRLLLTLHHIVSDGWSTGLLVRELAVLYEAFRHGRPAALPGLPVQYADYAAWQRGWLQGETLATRLAFWRGQLAGAAARLDLPADHPPSATPGSRGDRQATVLAAGVADRMAAFSRARGVTPFMTGLAALQGLLHVRPLHRRSGGGP
jgi:acyl carrier protein